MSQSVIEFGLLAAIALFIGWRLYITLGQDDGPPEGRTRVQAPPEQDKRQDTADVIPLNPTFTGPAATALRRFTPQTQTSTHGRLCRAHEPHMKCWLLASPAVIAHF